MDSGGPARPLRQLSTLVVLQPRPESGGKVPKLTREIYSDPVGTSHTPHVDDEVRAPITKMSIWGWSLIDALAVDYGGTWGPRQGDSDGGSHQPPEGWTGAISAENPVTVASGYGGDVINAMQLTFKSGTQTHMCGDPEEGGDPYAFSYAGQVLSGAKVMGVSEFHATADCVIFGLRYPDSC